MDPRGRSFRRTSRHSLDPSEAVVHPLTVVFDREGDRFRYTDHKTMRDTFDGDTEHWNSDHTGTWSASPNGGAGGALVLRGRARFLDLHRLQALAGRGHLPVRQAVSSGVPRVLRSERVGGGRPAARCACSGRGVAGGAMILDMDPRVSSLQARLGLAEAQVRQLREEVRQLREEVRQLRALVDGLSERGPRSSRRPRKRKRRHTSGSPEPRRAPA